MILCYVIILLYLEINTWPPSRYQAYQMVSYVGPQAKYGVPGQYAWKCDNNVFNFLLHVCLWVFKSWRRE